MHFNAGNIDRIISSSKFKFLKKMWLDIHQNVKSTNIRIVRVLKPFLLSNTIRNNIKLLKFPCGKNGKSSCSLSHWII